MNLPDNSVEIINDKIYMEWSSIRAIVKHTGLKTKKRRKILKRWRRFMNEAIRNGLDNYAGPTDSGS